jgi:hypothetical protein
MLKKLVERPLELFVKYKRLQMVTDGYRWLQIKKAL